MIANGTVKCVNPESKWKEFRQPAGKRDLQQLHVDMFEPGRTTSMILMLTSSILFFQTAAWHWSRRIQKKSLLLFEPDHEQSRSPNCISNILFNRITNIPDDRLSSRPLYWHLFLPPIPRQSSPNLASTVSMWLQSASFFSWRSMSPSTPKILHELHPRIFLGS